MSEWQERMDAAADVAAEALDEMLDAMTPEQREGAEQLAGWMKEHTPEAGYKRLCRLLYSGRCGRSGSAGCC